MSLARSRRNILSGGCSAVAAATRVALGALFFGLGRLQTRKGGGRHCEAKPKQSITPAPLAAAFSLAPI